jgi:hypothetical protein
MSASGLRISESCFSRTTSQCFEESPDADRVYGGATSFRNGTDNIAVIEIMTEELDRTFWRTLRRKSNASYPRRRSSSAPGNQPVITEQELYSL